MNFKKVVKSIQTAGYNCARTVRYLLNYLAIQGTVAIPFNYLFYLHRLNTKLATVSYVSANSTVQVVYCAFKQSFISESLIFFNFNLEKLRFVPLSSNLGLDIFLFSQVDSVWRSKLNFQTNIPLMKKNVFMLISLLFWGVICGASS